MRKLTFLALAALFMASVFVSSCNKNEDPDWEEYVKELKKMHIAELDSLKAYIARENISETPSKTGLYKIVLKEGTGDATACKKVVTVHYIGSLLNGKEFDNSYKREKPITFQHGLNSMIPGFEEGIGTMKKGEKARLIFPSDLGYGVHGNKNIPPFSSLIFDVEVVDFK